MIQRISRKECVALYNIEIHFFDALVESGLIAVMEEQNELYLDFEDLNNLENYVNLHYDLEINIPGIEVISRLLKTVRELQEENKNLQSKPKDPDIEIGFVAP
ncbi:MAG: MerR family transcriptional regulator [Sphingobacteriales bacterium]|nr:MAG: MerR family transcriptional regulator [Sphingobacteriales bacterium]